MFSYKEGNGADVGLSFVQNENSATSDNKSECKIIILHFLSLSWVLHYRNVS